MDKNWLISDLSFLRFYASINNATKGIEGLLHLNTKNPSEGVFVFWKTVDMLSLIYYKGGHCAGIDANLGFWINFGTVSRRRP